MTTASFLLAMVLLVQRHPRFSQLSSAIFGLFYCGYLPCFWIKLRCGLAVPAINTSTYLCQYPLMQLACFCMSCTRWCHVHSEVSWLLTFLPLPFSSSLGLWVFWYALKFSCLKFWSATTGVCAELASVWPVLLGGQALWTVGLLATIISMSTIIAADTGAFVGGRVCFLSILFSTS